MILSGGGTGGHIIPNIALIHELNRRFELAASDLLYIGSKDSMEEKLIGEMGVEFVGITCGKLRRYFPGKIWEIFLECRLGFCSHI